jgi:hypothetical protein
MCSQKLGVFHIKLMLLTAVINVERVLMHGDFLPRYGGAQTY